MIRFLPPADAGIHLYLLIGYVFFTFFQRRNHDDGVWTRRDRPSGGIAKKNAFYAGVRSKKRAVSSGDGVFFRANARAAHMTKSKLKCTSGASGYHGFRLSPHLRARS